ncbi:hypothetical protein JHK87_022528 [Glycine soja]|nr:hypothetical protein JHK87_022528 [Glycine soja]
MVQKAINEGKLKFEEKPMKVDIDPFHIQGNYVEPMQIMMIGASIGTSKVSIPPSKEEVSMESNGKGVSIDGVPLPFEAGEIDIISIHNCNNLQLTGTSHLNSARNHISINNSNHTHTFNATITAPQDSPKTDGIDVSQSSYILIQHSTIVTSKRH